MLLLCVKGDLCKEDELTIVFILDSLVQIIQILKFCVVTFTKVLLVTDT